MLLYDDEVYRTVYIFELIQDIRTDAAAIAVLDKGNRTDERTFKQ